MVRSGLFGAVPGGAGGVSDWRGLFSIMFRQLRKWKRRRRVIQVQSIKECETVLHVVGRKRGGCLAFKMLWCLSVVDHWGCGSAVRDSVRRQ